MACARLTADTQFYIFCCGGLYTLREAARTGENCLQIFLRRAKTGLRFAMIRGDILQTIGHQIRKTHNDRPIANDRMMPNLKQK